MLRAELTFGCSCADFVFSYRGHKAIRRHCNFLFKVDSLYKIAGQQYLLVGVQRWFSDRNHYTALVRKTASPGSGWIEYDDAIVEEVDGAVVFRNGVPTSLFFRRMQRSSVDAFNAEATASKAKSPGHGGRSRKSLSQ
ncbi:unnamed protein product [Pylaiella littoralis]